MKTPIIHELGFQLVKDFNKTVLTDFVEYKKMKKSVFFLKVEINLMKNINPD